MFGAKLVVKLVKPCLKVQCDKEMETAFLFEEETVNIGYDFDDGNDCGFLRHLREEHKCEFTDSYSTALWSLLHEIGHFETDYLVEDSDEDLMVRFLCAITPYEVAQKDVNHQNRYFNLEAEWLATEWAIDWIKAHPIKARIFSVLARI